MEIFLNKCDDKANDLELVKKEEVLEEIALVTIVDLKAKYENEIFFFETINDLKNDVLTIEKRGEKKQVNNRSRKSYLAKNDVFKIFW